MKKILFVIYCFGITTPFLSAQTNQKIDSSLVSLNRNFMRDFSLDSSVKLNSYKSPFVSGTLSVILPGSGQIYNRSSFWRTALYLIIEATSWYCYFLFDKKGNDLTISFQNFADDHWDVGRYINWIQKNYKNWNDSLIDKTIIKNNLDSIYISDDLNKKNWERIDFDKLNKIERSITPFSHTLYNHGEQQYYEMIGKYSQFRSGWDDHNFNGDTIKIYDPSFTSTNNTDYTYQRANTNKILGYTNVVIATIILNHIASAIDAVISSNTNNKVNFNAQTYFKSNINNQNLFLTSLMLKIKF